MEGKAGVETTSSPKFKDAGGQESEKPEGAKFALAKDAPTDATINEETGEITYKPSIDQAGNTVNIPVIVTYKDGSTDEVKAPIKVAQGDNLNYEPDYKSVVAQVGHEVTVASPDFLDADGNKVAQKPAVAKYELGEGAKSGVTINETTGEIKYTAVNADKDTVIEVPVIVTYKDGSKESVKAKIDVPSDANFYDPKAKPLTTEQGTVPPAKDGVEFKFTPPEDTRYEWQAVPKVNEAGQTTGIVKVSYPDGTEDVVKVPVTVKASASKKTTVDDTNIKPVDPTDQKQGTGIIVTNPDKTTTVSAKDANDKVVTPVINKETGEIEVTPGKDAKGPITVTVTDSDLPEGKKEIEVPVAEKSAQPEVTAPTAGDQTISGTGTAGSRIDLALKGGEGSEDRPIAKDVLVGQDGTWTAEVPAGMLLKENNTVVATQKEDGKSVSDPVEAKVAAKAEEETSAKPTITEPKAGDTTVSGTGVPGAKVVLKDKDGNKIGEATVDKDGNWKVENIPADKLVQGEKVTAEQTEPGKKPATKEAEIAAKDEQTSAEPTITQPKAGDTSVSGTGVPGATVVLKDKDGNEIGKATVDKDGNWKVENIPADKLVQGEKVTAEQTEPGKKPATKEAEIAAKDEQTSAEPTITQPKAGDTSVSGTGVPGATVVLKDKDGNEIGKATVDKDGNWKVENIPIDKLVQGEKVTAEQTEPGKKPATKEAEIAAKDEQTSAEPTITQPKAGDTSVSGTGVPGATVVLKDKDGNEIGKATVDKDGNWKVENIPADKLVQGEKVTAEQTEPGKAPAKADATVAAKATEESAKPTVDAKDDGSVEVTPPTDADTKTVEVTYTDNDGNKKTVTATKGDDGKWSVPDGSDVTVDPDTGVITVPADKVKDGTEVSAKAKDGSGNESEAGTAKAKTPSGTGETDKPTITNGKAENQPGKDTTTVTGKTKPNTEVTVKTPDGKETKVTSDENGDFTVEVPKQEKDAKITITPKGGEAKEVSVKTASDKPSAPSITWRGLWFLGGKTEPAKTSKEMETGRHYKYLYGYVDKTVRPEGMITRSEAAALIARLANLDMSDKTKPDFKDTPSAWYNSAINAMVSRNLMFADKNGNFRPNEPITRGEFARALYYIDKKNDKVAPFADVKGHEFEEAINQAYGNGRIAGYPDGTFKPNAKIQRAEAARILNQYADRNVNLVGMANVKRDLVRFTDINESHWAYCEVMEAANSHEYQRAKGTLAETWLRILDK
ncbi:hypothetical protein HMPREF9130_1187 [Peptoniphilus sp. oral taxon 375 str. F0436]|nr:hypothetical protein HMPREF9130_1187 [Peptoniphilus sp. oral taxon 375 str. F0436]